MHTRLKDSITTTEALQAAAYLYPLLQHSYLITVLRKDTATGQTSKPTTYNHTLFHFEL